MNKYIFLIVIIFGLLGQTVTAQTAKAVVQNAQGQWYRVLATDEVQKSSDGINYQTISNINEVLPANRATVRRALYTSKYLGATIYYVETYRENGRDITKYFGGLQGKNWKDVPNYIMNGVAYGQASVGNKNNAFGYWLIRPDDGMVMYSTTGTDFQPTEAKALIHEHKRDLPISGSNVFVHDGHLVAYHWSEKRGFFKIPKEGGFVELIPGTDKMLTIGSPIQHPDNSAKLYSHNVAILLGDLDNANDPKRRAITQDLKPTIQKWANDNNINYEPVTAGPAYEMVNQWLRDNYFYVTVKIRVKHGSTASNHEQNFRIHLANPADASRLFQFDAIFEPTDESFIPQVNNNQKANTEGIQKANPALRRQATPTLQKQTKPVVKPRVGNKGDN